MSVDALAARFGPLVADPEALRAQGLFVVEGREGIGRLLDTPLTIEAMLLAPSAHAALAPRLEGRQVPVCELSPSAMRDLTGFNFHRGALAFARRPEPQRPGDVVAAALNGAPVPPVFVAAEHLVDVDNVGSCFRNARAFGVRGVLLDERCPDPLYRKAIRTSMGAVLEVPWALGPMSDILEALDAASVQAVALDVSGSSPLRDVRDRLDPLRPVALLVGNEGQGLSEATLSRVAWRARIPMADGADSLNVATALAVALYEHTR